MKIPGFYKSSIIVIILMLFCNCCFINDKEKKGNDSLVAINDSIIHINEKKSSVEEEILKNMGLCKIQDSIPEILVDLKYASTDNFVGINFYGNLKDAYVQYECLLKLKKAYNILQETKPNYTFLIYDAVRSEQAQQLMWDSLKVPFEQKFWYIADPKRGSIHNYGMALDLTIVDDIGNVLDMGTKFDYFGELAYSTKTEYFYEIGVLSKEQYFNRLLLKDVMIRAGFYVSKTEWWHYNATSLNIAKEKYQIFSLEK